MRTWRSGFMMRFGGVKSGMPTTNSKPRPSKVEIRSTISQLSRINCDAVDFGYIKKIYSRMTDGFASVVAATPGHELFFRSRIMNSGRPAGADDLSAPPPGKVTGFQRCNRPGVPMFYASSKRITALLEVRPSIGDIIYLSEWMGDAEIPVNVTLDGADDKFIALSPELDCIIQAHLETIFTRRVHSTFSNDYKLTAAITELFTAKFPPDDIRFIRSDGLVGIRYPSVFDYTNSYNTALPSALAKDRMKLNHVIEAKVTGIEGDGVSLEVLDNAFDFDGKTIIWSGCADHIPAPRGPKGEVPFRFSGTVWRREVLKNPGDSRLIPTLLLE